MLDHLPIDPAKVHPMPRRGGPYGDDIDAAAKGYADELAAAAGPGTGTLPRFDVAMLGWATTATWPRSSLETPE